MFFDIVDKKLKPYPILQLQNLDADLFSRARELQRDPRYTIRKLRNDITDTIISYDKTPDGMYLIRKVAGEKWIDGATYGTALKNSYKRVGNTVVKIVRYSAGGAIIALPLYLSYILLYTIIPLYPIIGTIQEADKLKEPVIVEVALEEHAVRDYFEGETEAPLEFMMIKAREERSQTIRKSVRIRSPSRSAS